MKQNGILKILISKKYQKKHGPIKIKLKSISKLLKSS